MMLSVRWSPANQMQEPAKEGGGPGRVIDKVLSHLCFHILYILFRVREYVWVI